MKKTILTLALAAFATTGFTQTKISAKGSDTIGAKLMPRLAEAYKTAGNDVTFEIEDKGSSSAFTNLEGGTADFGMSSRSVKEEEKEMFTAKGQELKEHVAAIDMIAVIVNEANGVDSLTMEQVEGIFTGDITDWSQVGGKPGKITAYTRNETSGTYKTFQEMGMSKRDYGSDSQKMEGNEPIATETASNAGGIGYVGLAYATKEGIKAISIDGVEPVPANKADYPLARELYYYTIGAPEGEVGEFLTWAMTSEEASEIVADVGFIPAN